MASRAILMGRVSVLICGVFLLIVGLCVGSPNHSRRLVCWKAILKCHGEPECHYAYDQYLYACASVISGARKKCPSHCISSLIQLNQTQSGPALEDCDCALDPVCSGTKQAIEPCLPRTSIMGCTEARLQCESDLSCSSAMRDYLFHCRKLFGGERCSDGCRRVIANMRTIPKAHGEEHMRVHKSQHENFLLWFQRQVRRKRLFRLWGGFWRWLYRGLLSILCGKLKRLPTFSDCAKSPDHHLGFNQIYLKSCCHCGKSSQGVSGPV